MRDRVFFKSVIAYSSAVAAIAGIAFFCVARIAYSIYYARFGISPDAIGANFPDLLARQASGVNIALATIVTGIMLRAGWLLNEAGARESEVQDLVDNAKSKREVIVSSIASDAAADIAEAKRDLARLEGEEQTFEDQLS